MMLAGIDGIKNQIDPGDGVDVDLFELPAGSSNKSTSTPSPGSIWFLIPSIPASIITENAK